MKMTTNTPTTSTPLALTSPITPTTSSKTKTGRRIKANDQQLFDKYRTNKIILIYSGWLDSTTVMFDLLDRGYDVIPLIVNYGQKHGNEELESANKLASKYCSKKIELDLSHVSIFQESWLVNKNKVIKNGLYDKENISTTMVWNRNSILANYWLAYAMSEWAIWIALWIHSEDSTTWEIEYPDCSPKFVQALSNLAREIDFREYEVIVPFSGKSKVDVVKRGLELNVPYYMTWSCYKWKDSIYQNKPCGECGTCIQRLSAFRKNKSYDPLEYAPFTEKTLDLVWYRVETIKPLTYEILKKYKELYNLPDKDLYYRYLRDNIERFCYIESKDHGLDEYIALLFKDDKSTEDDKGNKNIKIDYYLLNPL